jgi:hypothetical protein
VLGISAVSRHVARRFTILLPAVDEGYPLWTQVWQLARCRFAVANHPQIPNQCRWTSQNLVFRLATRERDKSQSSDSIVILGIAINAMSFILPAIIALLCFALLYEIARQRNRDRPWLWGLVGAALFPAVALGILLGIYAFVHGRSLFAGLAYLCHRCRKPTARPQRQEAACAHCGNRLTA